MCVFPKGAVKPSMVLGFLFIYKCWLVTRPPPSFFRNRVYDYGVGARKGGGEAVGGGHNEGGGSIFSQLMNEYIHNNTDCQSVSSVTKISFTSTYK